MIANLCKGNTIKYIHYDEDFRCAFDKLRIVNSTAFLFDKGEMVMTSDFNNFSRVPIDLNIRDNFTYGNGIFCTFRNYNYRELNDDLPMNTLLYRYI